MGIFSSKNKKGNISINLEYIDGIQGYQTNSAVTVSLNTKENNLEINTRVFKKPTVKLNFDKIISFNVLDEKTILEKKRSVMGRAFVGSLLLGPAGAIIGGLSATENKKIIKNNTYFIFNYSNGNIDDIKVLTFKIVGATLHLNKFLNELNKLVPLDNDKVKEIINKYNLNINKNEQEQQEEIIL